MATTGRAADMLARAIKKSNNTNTAWVPRPQQVSFHQATLTRVDTFNGIADCQMPDPSGLILPAVKYMVPYTSSNLPSIGDVVHMIHTGTDVLIMGQHISLNGFVVL
jgi:hypothetical protein